jgi:hypothetical protein
MAGKKCLTSEGVAEILLNDDSNEDFIPELDSEDESQ